MPTRIRSSESSQSSLDTSSCSPLSGTYLSEKEDNLQGNEDFKTHDEDAYFSGQRLTTPSGPAPKRKRAKFIRKVNCQVCGDVANDHIHYGAIACYSCRAFFRRGVNSNANYFCSLEKSCHITKNTRKHCQFCRFQKCKDVGMKSSWVMTEEDKKEKRKRAQLKRIKAQTLQLQRASKQSKKYRRSGSKRALSSFTNRSPRNTVSYSRENLLDESQQPHHYNSRTRSPPGLFDEHPALNTCTEPHYEYYSATIPAKTEPFFPHLPSYDYEETTSPSSELNLHQVPSHHIPPYNTNSPLSFEDKGRDSIPSDPGCSFSRATVPYADIEPVELPQSESYSLDNVHVNLEKEFNAQISDIFERLEHKSVNNSTLGELLAKFTVPMDLSQQSSSSMSKIQTQFLSSMQQRQVPLLELRETGFSERESHIICNVMVMEEEVSKVIPIPMNIMAAMISSCQRRVPVPSQVCLEGYLICMRRIILLATKLDFFTGFSLEDQKALLLANTDMIVNIRTARFLQPGKSLGKQIAVANGNISHEESVELQEERLHFAQIFNSPWAYTYEHERLYHELLKKIFDLQLDEISTVLISMMSLFSTTNVNLKEKVNAIQIQEFFTELLKKYITRKMNKETLNCMLPKYIMILSDLEEMARIIVSNRLNL